MVHSHLGDWRDHLFGRIFAFAKGIADSRILKVLPQLQQLGGFKEFIALGDGQNSELLSVTL